MNIKFITCFFLFLSVISFGQINKPIKGTYVVLHSEGGIIFNEYSSFCGLRDEPVLEKRKSDSLQVVLNNFNLSIKDKNYVYYMRVYKDYSYDLIKEYQFQIFNETNGNTISGEEYRRYPKDW